MIYLINDEGFLLLLLMGFGMTFSAFFIALFIKVSKVKKNNKLSPIITVPARVALIETVFNMQSFRIVFEYNNGERVSLFVNSSIASVCVVGDEGTLSFQGTKFINFDRNIVQNNN